MLDLAVALALGGNCPADIALLRAAPDVCGLVASDPMVSRVIDDLVAKADVANLIDLIDSVTLAVEVTRIVPASGNLALRQAAVLARPGPGRHPGHAPADTTVVHLLIDGVRLKTVPFRLTAAVLGRLLAEGGKATGPPSVSTGPVTPGGPVEVERLSTPAG